MKTQINQIKSTGVVISYGTTIIKISISKSTQRHCVRATQAGWTQVQTLVQKGSHS